MLELYCQINSPSIFCRRTMVGEFHVSDSASICSCSFSIWPAHRDKYLHFEVYLEPADNRSGSFPPIDRLLDLIHSFLLGNWGANWISRINRRLRVSGVVFKLSSSWYFRISLKAFDRQCAGVWFRCQKGKRTAQRTDWIWWIMIRVFILEPRYGKCVVFFWTVICEVFFSLGFWMTANRGLATSTNSLTSISGAKTWNWVGSFFILKFVAYGQLFLPIVHLCWQIKINNSISSNGLR